MTARIVPRPKTGDSLLALPAAKAEEPQSLAYAVEDKIYVLFGEESGGGSVKVAERPNWIRALAVYNGELVDAGSDGRIMYTGTDEPINHRFSRVNALAVLGGCLIDASEREIRYTATDELIRQRPKCVGALAVLDGRLVDTGDYKEVLYTATDELIERRPGWVKALAVLDGRLVDVGESKQIRYTDDISRLINLRPGAVWGLAVLNGRLIDAGDYKQVVYTETDEPILTADGVVSALCPIPLSLAESLAYGGRGFR